MTYIGEPGSKLAMQSIFDLYSVRTLDESKTMRLSSQIRSISYLKANAAEIVRNLGRQGQPLIITQNGEARAVIQDIASYEETQETMALLKILALGMKEVESGHVQPAADTIARLREPGEST